MSFSEVFVAERAELTQPDSGGTALEGYVAFVLQNGNLTRSHYLPAPNPQKVVAQLRCGNRGPRRATQPLVLPRLSAISAPCTSA